MSVAGIAVAVPAANIALERESFASIGFAVKAYRSSFAALDRRRLEIGMGLPAIAGRGCSRQAVLYNEGRYSRH